jgi:hypothetical protein
MANKEQEKKMIDIKIKNNEAEIEFHGKKGDVLFEMELINKTFYETLKKEGDPVAVLSFKVSMMEMITGSHFDKKRITEWLQIQKRITPEEAEDIIKDLMEERNEQECD